MIYRYGIIWLVWIVVNRFLCERLQMADSLLNFAQIAGVLGGFEVAWPTSLATFLNLCGILDFDIDVTGPSCIVWWSWGHDMVLQLSLPLVFGLVNVLQYTINLALHPKQDELMRKHRRAKMIMKYLAIVNCLYMTLVRYTIGAFVCFTVTGDDLQVFRA